MIVLKPLLQVADIALELYMWLIIISAVLSWLVAFNVVNTRNQLVFTIGNSIMRVAAVQVLGFGEIGNWPYVMGGIGVMVGGALLVKTGLS